MDIDRLLSSWMADPSIAANIAYIHRSPAREPDIQNFPEEVHPQLVSALSLSGITSLYRHQEMVFNLASRQKNVVLCTGTASGKTLAYDLPVLNELFTNPESSALYIFPTKALAQDQKAHLDSLLSRSSRKKLKDEPGTINQTQLRRRD